MPSGLAQLNLDEPAELFFVLLANLLRLAQALVSRIIESVIASTYAGDWFVPRKLSLWRSLLSMV